MIVAFSTSSPWSSVALIEEDRVLWSDSALAENRASEKCLAMLDASVAAGLNWRTATLFAADIGPGSFTGVRVGIMLAKTFAFTHGVSVAGADAFDLISPDRAVALPSKRGEFFVREPGQSPYRTTEANLNELVGYGGDFQDAKPPLAAGFVSLIHRLKPVDPIVFLPEYLIEPSISVPKKPYRHA